MLMWVAISYLKAVQFGIGWVGLSKWQMYTCVSVNTTPQKSMLLFIYCCLLHCLFSMENKCMVFGIMLADLETWIHLGQSIHTLHMYIIQVSLTMSKLEGSKWWQEGEKKRERERECVCVCDHAGEWVMQNCNSVISFVNCDIILDAWLYWM